MSETRTLTTLLCSPHCCVLYCFVTGVETSHGMKTGMSLKSRKKEPRAGCPMLFFSFRSYAIVLILLLSFLSVYLKALFFSWLASSAHLFCAWAQRAVLTPFIHWGPFAWSTHHWLGNRLSLLSWNSLWNISGFLSASDFSSLVSEICPWSTVARRDRSCRQNHRNEDNASLKQVWSFPFSRCGNWG